MGALGASFIVASFIPSVTTIFLKIGGSYDFTWVWLALGVSLGLGIAGAVVGGSPLTFIASFGTTLYAILNIITLPVSDFPYKNYLMILTTFLFLIGLFLLGSGGESGGK